MFCLNLPLNIRYDPENVFLVCIVPGPGSPSLDDINHILRSLVDTFVPFWKTGIYYSETPSYSGGRLICCAILPLVCDLPAARQIAGFTSHGSHNFCSFCNLRLVDIDDIECIKLRTNTNHRLRAKEC